MSRRTGSSAVADDDSCGAGTHCSDRRTFALAHRLPADDVVLTMIQDGDHRLSRPQDIARLIAAVAEIG